jgi:citrate synthase
MGTLISTIAAYSTLKAEANPAISGESIYKDAAFRNKQIYRLMGMIPTLAANAYRNQIGR